MVKRVVILGGSGFIGRYIAQALLKQGWQVRIASRFPHDADFLKPLGNVGQITFFKTDILQEEPLKAALQGMDAVINLVGILHEKKPQTFEAIHHQGAKRVAMLASALGIKKLIHLSALGASLASPSSYARSKAAGEEAVKKHYSGATILQPSVVFGAEDHFLNKFAKIFSLFPLCPVLGKGKMQPVSVMDLAQAVTFALADNTTQGKTYALTGPKIYTLKELMEWVIKATHRRCWLFPVPVGMGRFLGKILEVLPYPPFTRDQITLLQQDNILEEGVLSLKDLGISPMPLEGYAPTYLKRYYPCP